MAYNRKDYFFHKAKEEDFVARSVFKLQEIDTRFKLLKPGFKVLDLGAAPGSWSQYASKVIGKKGILLGIDLQPIRLTLPNAVFVVGDFLKLSLDELLQEHEALKASGFSMPVDVVLSDMAPKTTGVRVTDQTRSAELCRMALDAARKYLRPDGSFVVKLFHSDEFELFRNELKQVFERVEILRPASTRRESKEIFLIGLKFKGGRDRNAKQ